MLNAPLRPHGGLVGGEAATTTGAMIPSIRKMPK